MSKAARNDQPDEPDADATAADAERRKLMSNPAPKAEPNLEHAPDLLAFQRRAAEAGLHVRLPSPNPNWDLPEPVDLGGASLGDMVVRLRRADP
jgi:hypothetical protein